jgi:hypothetical protein
MEGIACSRLRELRDEVVDVAVDLPLQRRLPGQLALKSSRAHAQRISRPLHHRLHERRSHSQRERHAHHALTADHGHFERRVALEWRQQRHQAIEGKIDVTYGRVGLIEYIPGSKHRRREKLEQSRASGRARRRESCWLSAGPRLAAMSREVLSRWTCRPYRSPGRKYCVASFGCKRARRTCIPSSCVCCRLAAAFACQRALCSARERKRRDLPG